MDGFVAALASVGFTATEVSAVKRTGAYVVAAWIGRDGHAFTVIDGTPRRTGRDAKWLRARKQRAWVVS